MSEQVPSDDDRHDPLGGPMRRFCLQALGPPQARRLARWSRHLPRITAREPELKPLSDDQLRRRAQAARGRILACRSLDAELEEVFALVREAARRRLGMRPFDVQVLGGIGLHRGCVVEMVTGEGKTLAATMPVVLNAMLGRGVHVVTVNDYLARRDAQWMGPIYQALGLSVGCIQTGMPEPQRRQAYGSDITYGTAKEFGFDFLRDQLRCDPRRLQTQGQWFQSFLHQQGIRLPECVQRETVPYCIVDEADSILIDEARTPLIISGPASDPRLAEAYTWADHVARQLQRDVHYEFDPDARRAELLPAGRQRVRSFPTPKILWIKPNPEAPYEHVERSLEAHHGYRLERDYLIVGGKVVIVDEFTGRMMPGRQWSRGLHQAVEAKEGLPVNVGTETLARTTIQQYFLRYEKLAGMTGTAATAAREFRKIYGCQVAVIPTNRPLIRRALPDRIFASQQAKLDAVAQAIAELHALGRPVLVGTRSVEKSQQLSRRLEQLGIDHQVLNAKHHEQEAAIVAHAGQPGAVTIATNMAGRGTDIRLGDGVAARGGLAVLGTERHDARRIDDQLAGRCGRQGDPGTSQFFLSLEDDLITQADIATGRWRRSLEANRLGPVGRRRLRGLFARAQRRVERQHLKARKTLMEYEKAREKWKRQLGLNPLLGE